MDEGSTYDEPRAAEAGGNEDEKTEPAEKVPQRKVPKKRKRASERLVEAGKLMRARLIRVRMTRDQMTEARKMFGAYRSIYNACVDAERKKEIDGASNVEMRKWRTKLTKKENYMQQRPWVDGLPCHARQDAVSSFFAAKKTQLKRCALGKITHFNMRKKSRYRDRQECIPFERHRVVASEKTIETCIDRKPLTFRVVGKLPKELRGRNDTAFLRREIKLIKTRLGQYFVSVPLEMDQHPTRFQQDEGNVCAMDPGARTFQTVYATDGTVAQIGESFDELDRSLKRADLLQKYLDTMKGLSGRRRRHIKRRKLRLLQRVRNRVNDLHNKVVHWLCTTYRVILIPTFETHNMVQSDALSCKTCRSMMTWSHFKFKQKLISHSQLFKDCKVFEVSEAFTTQTCGHCGHLHVSIGSNKHFQCPHCGCSVDRDENAARNVLLRNLPLMVKVE